MITTLKTYCCFFIAILFYCQIGQAQCTNWKKYHNYWQIKAGVGLFPTFPKGHVKSELPPLSLELRYRPNKFFSLGLMAGRSISATVQTHHTGAKQSIRHDFQMLAFRASVNTQRWKKWQAYGGIFLAYQHSKIKSKMVKKDSISNLPIHFKPKNTGLLYSGFVGMAFSPMPKMEVFGELSYGLSIVTVGVGYSW